MRFQIAVLVGFSFVLPARGDVMQLPLPVIDALTPIDSIPSSAQLDDVFNGSAQALASLQTIALEAAPPDDLVGVKLRAIRALTHYCVVPCSAGDPAHATIVAVATSPRPADMRTGSDILVLRAAIESLGILRVPGDVDLLIAQLQDSSRDIRAAAARALRDLGNTQAIVPLRQRYQQESVPQVKLAISDALRVLGQPI
jgi:HEAT repeat protein